MESDTPTWSQLIKVLEEKKPKKYIGIRETWGHVAQNYFKSL